MITLDTRRIVGRLTTLESIAVIPRVASTNLVGRRIVNECIENELLLPKAIIIAGEQFAGRGRNARQWSSPAGKGIYATTLLSMPADLLPLLPLEMANIVASYLREVFAIDARVKWPNDILVGGRKIAGILIEARMSEERAFLLIGTGINVEPVVDELRPNAITISEASPRDFRGIDVATEAFIEHLDQRLGRPMEREAVLAEWRGYSIHKTGDRIQCLVGERNVEGTWDGIDEHGHALLRHGGETLAVSAGDLILL
ncbi:MAG TPA: biotin--[acetyl-CoA-carboxylase] ligase [Thermoanaerobaculia bacterium]|jgi:BirA family biotin operon repressor/biotin-[acetyl-CoA-carboxylase] ligase|nr:biotin--[acetyl-CoA-carboxylase] ligase [Thermoanaerobaculia bacterium]